MPTIADKIVKTLKKSGVRRVYGLPGDSLNGFTDAIRRDGYIQWAHVRHEEAPAFAAGAEAAITGELAVTAAMTAHYRRARDRLDRLATEKGNGPLHPQFVAATINQFADDDAIFIADVGTPSVWAARYLHMNGRRRLLGSFVHGSMANALLQGVGPQASQPGRQVVALSGDGGLAMMLGELITLRQENLPVKIVVFNNGALSFVELEMKAAGFVNFGTDLDNPDFAGVARAVGLYGATVERGDELEEALRAAFAHEGAAVVDVRIARQELSMPPKITLAQAKGFSLYATKTLLSGRSDEILELVKTNLRELGRE